MLNFISSSDNSKKPLIFIHGIGSTSETFQNQIESFKKENYVVSIDLPGFGKSKMLKETSISNYASTIYNFLITQKITKPILVGHSLGGMIVQNIITQYLNYAEAAILVATSSRFGSKDITWQNNYINSRLEPLNKGKTMEDISVTAIKNIIGPYKNKDVIKFAGKIMSSISVDAYRAAILSLINFDLSEQFTKISIPILLIAGKNDIQAPAKTMLSMSKKFKNNKYIEVNDCGHLIHLEKPEIFNNAIKKFIINL
jgi:3-oxoadipate enol-lactonase